MYYKKEKKTTELISRHQYFVIIFYVRKKNQSNDFGGKFVAYEWNIHFYEPQKGESNN